MAVSYINSEVYKSDQNQIFKHSSKRARVSKGKGKEPAFLYRYEDEGDDNDDIEIIVIGTDEKSQNEWILDGEETKLLNDRDDLDFYDESLGIAAKMSDDEEGFINMSEISLDTTTIRTFRTAY